MDLMLTECFKKLMHAKNIQQPVIHCGIREEVMTTMKIVQSYKGLDKFLKKIRTLKLVQAATRFELRYFDPFLVLDEFSVTAPAGCPDHPYRGFEIVTYMLQGAVRHEDFEGHKGTIGEGDVQWMTAGRGIVHSEMPASQGTQKGSQLWINLSSKHKMLRCVSRLDALRNAGKNYTIKATPDDREGLLQQGGMVCFERQGVTICQERRRDGYLIDDVFDVCRKVPVA